MVLFLRTSEDETARVVVESRGARVHVAWPDRADEADAAFLPGGRLSVVLEDGRQFCGRGIERSADGVRVVHPARSVMVPITRTRRFPAAGAALPGAGGVEEVRALMHGRIVEVCATPGDRVEAGALLLVLEAMKMQNEIRASHAGQVGRVEVSPGQTVEGGALLLSIRSDNN